MEQVKCKRCKKEFFARYRSYCQQCIDYFNETRPNNRFKKGNYKQVFDFTTGKGGYKRP